MKYFFYAMMCCLLLPVQGQVAADASKNDKNPLREVAMELLARGGVARRMKVPACVVSNKLDGAVAYRIDGTRTTLWVGEPAHDGIAAWSAGFYTRSGGSLEAELRFFNFSDSRLTLPAWASACGTNIAAGVVIAFEQQWLPSHTNSMPVATSVEPPVNSANALVKAAIEFRRKGDGAKASKSLRMALLADPLDVWSVVERTFLEDDGDGAIDALMRDRANPALHFESVCNSYIKEKAFKEVEILLAQSSDFPVFEKVRERIKNKLQSVVKNKETSK